MTNIQISPYFYGVLLLKSTSRVNIFEETAYLFPNHVQKISYFFPKLFDFDRYSTMVGENFESCTSQMPRNSSK